MFTKQDKIKELAIYLAKKPQAQVFINQNSKYEPVGVSVVMTYQYDIADIKIVYDKWFVECFDLSKEMNLPGVEHHDKLVKGSSVTVFSQHQGTFKFYKQDANDIISACENGRDLSKFMHFNKWQR